MMRPLTLRASAVLALALFASAGLGPSSSLARPVTDSAGRQVTVPDKVTRVFAAGPPAAVLQYVLAPQTLTGWARPPRPQDKPFLTPATRDLPALGRLTGAGDVVNLEVLVAGKPDLILDFGTIGNTYKSLADRIQGQAGLPYVLIDGTFANTPAALRLVGDIFGDKPRGEALATYAEAVFAEVDRIVAGVPAANRPKVYLARGPQGLETGTRGSINTEIIERVGGVNVVQGFGDRAGLVTASLEQVIAWAPDTIITVDPAFKANAAKDPAWAKVPAVANNRIFLAPDAPFGFIDSPPGLNRLVGLEWLMQILYPDRVTGDLRTKVREFYRLFYQVDVADADLDRLLAQPAAK